MDFTKYHFLYNAAAYFATQEKYPDGFFELLMRNDTEGLEALCWVLQEMSEQGELMRRYMGYDKEETFKASEAIVKMRPKDIGAARAIAMTAMDVGLDSSPDDEEEVDIVLVELQKKIKPQS